MPATQTPGDALNAALARSEQIQRFTEPGATISQDAVWDEIYQLSTEINILLRSISHVIHGASK